MHHPTDRIVAYNPLRNPAHTCFQPQDYSQDDNQVTLANNHLTENTIPKIGYTPNESNIL